MNPKTKQKLKFPHGFLWGAATAAYQVEGGIANNDWAADGRIAPAGIAADHYNRFRGDFDIAKNLNHNAHRISLEWSRIEPEKRKWDESALSHYHDVLRDLKDKDIKVFLTLHHYTNPKWFAELGGWKKKENIKYFLEYAAKVSQNLGHLVDFWITVNEPNVYAGLSYMGGKWPPFKKNPFLGFQVYKNMLSAHNRAYEMIHNHYPEAEVGFSQNIAFNEPRTGWNLFDKLAVKFADYMSIDFAYNRTQNDFLGLNHYFHNRISFNPFSIVKINNQVGELTDKGWEIFPPAIYEALIKLSKYNMPIYITENGIADAKDKKRADYIKDYLKQVKRAIDENADVKGYLYWSLLDNYEWPVAKGETGYESKFGLVEVDFRTQERIIRKSAEIYAEICKTNSLDI
jgi:beta-glucosidase